MCRFPHLLRNQNMVHPRHARILPPAHTRACMRPLLTLLPSPRRGALLLKMKEEVLQKWKEKFRRSQAKSQGADDGEDNAEAEGRPNSSKGDEKGGGGKPKGSVFPEPISAKAVAEGHASADPANSIPATWAVSVSSTRRSTASLHGSSGAVPVAEGWLRPSLERGPREAPQLQQPHHQHGLLLARASSEGLGPHQSPQSARMIPMRHAWSQQVQVRSPAQALGEALETEEGSREQPLTMASAGSLPAGAASMGRSGSSGVGGGQLPGSGSASAREQGPVAPGERDRASLEQWMDKLDSKLGGEPGAPGGAGTGTNPVGSGAGAAGAGVAAGTGAAGTGAAGTGVAAPPLPPVSSSGAIQHSGSKDRFSSRTSTGPSPAHVAFIAQISDARGSAAGAAAGGSAHGDRPSKVHKPKAATGGLGLTAFSKADLLTALGGDAAAAPPSRGGTRQLNSKGGGVPSKGGAGGGRDDDEEEEEEEQGRGVVGGIVGGLMGRSAGTTGRHLIHYNSLQLRERLQMEIRPPHTTVLKILINYMQGGDLERAGHR